MTNEKFRDKRDDADTEKLHVILFLHGVCSALRDVSSSTED